MNQCSFKRLSLGRHGAAGELFILAILPTLYNLVEVLFSYDLQLVIASIIVATVGAYACFDLMVQYRHSEGARQKPLLAASAVAMGGSIWAMHFIAMLAVQLPIEIRFDVLTTFVSVIVSVLATGTALVIGVTGSASTPRTILAGVVMGGGISGMHYIGMSGIRGNCVINYEIAWVVVSIAVAVVTSGAAISASLKLRGFRRRAVAAAFMGISISGMHYSGMLGTMFLPTAETVSFAQPMFSSFSLGMATAMATFVILGCTLWTLVPDKIPEPTQIAVEAASALDATGSKESEASSTKLPVQKNKQTHFIATSRIVYVASNGHYTEVATSDTSELWFCNRSLSEVAKMLCEQPFARVHRRYIVNLEFVDSFQRRGAGGTLLLCKGQFSVPVSRSSLPTVLEQLGI